MIRLQMQVDLEYDVQSPTADFFFFIHAAHTSHQHVLKEHLTINQQQAQWRLESVRHLPGHRCLRLTGHAGMLQLHYTATVEMKHHVEPQPENVPEVPLAHLPQEVLHYILPSRYCQSDRLVQFALKEFGALPQGYLRAQAICSWVREHVAFRSNSSVGTTSAVDTLLDRAGVCRDFAHLMIALCRACNMPARMATGTDYGADPALGPPDFHAYVEVFLGGRWYLFDPSGTAIPMGMMRLTTGCDAADVAFATIFGAVQGKPPRIQVNAQHDPTRDWQLPVHTHSGLSTA